MLTCTVCQSNQLKAFPAEEEMYGTKEPFTYWQCAQCDCLQLLTPPQNLAPYYPKNYYSFRAPAKRMTFKRWRRGVKRAWLLAHPAWLTKFMRWWLSDYSMFWTYQSLGVHRKSRVLDVGCGGGEHVLELRDAGVAQSLGIDPHIEQSILLNGQPFVHQKMLQDLPRIADSFDLITFHHSLEHMPNQLEALQCAAQLMSQDGAILVRIPTVSSVAFERYQAKWCQLDAPRHLYLHSHQSITQLAAQAGLDVQKMWCDSSEVQFIASEQYQQGIPLFDPRSYIQNRQTDLFSRQQIKDFQAQTDAANHQLRGDQICLVLKLKKDAHSPHLS